MGRRRGRAGRNDALAALAVLGMLIVLIWLAITTGRAGDWRASMLAASLTLTTIGGYLGFAMPRQCGAERASRPGPCGRRAHGVLNGCSTHPFAGLRRLLGRPTTVHDSGRTDAVYGRSSVKPDLRASSATIVVQDSSSLMKYVALAQLAVGVAGVLVSALPLLRAA